MDGLFSSILTNNPLAFGCMNLVENSYDSEYAKTILLTAWERGIRLFDIADSYGCGEGEILVGKTLPKEAFLTTKCGLIRNSKGRYLGIDASPKVIFQSCETSLRRLKRERIDIFFLHRVDPNVPIEKSIEAMKKLQEQGKIKAIGLCETKAETLKRAEKIAKISVLQSEYSIFSRDIENKILPACRELDIKLLAYAPLSRGLLGRFVERNELAKQDIRRILPRFFTENLPENQRLFTTVNKIAVSLNASPPQVALSWLLHQGKDIFPLFGASNPQHIIDNIQSISLQLPPNILKNLNKLARKVRGKRYNPMGMRFINK